MNNRLKKEHKINLYDLVINQSDIIVSINFSSCWFFKYSLLNFLDLIDVFNLFNF